MPAFQTVPLQEAMLKTATGRRAQLAQEYLQYIRQLPEGQAGKLQAIEDEKITTLRRRLGDAARLARINLVIKRTGEEIYFWVEPSEQERPARRRRGSRDREVEVREPEAVIEPATFS